MRSRKQDTAIFGCLVLAAIAYLPVSGIFPLNATVAEHWIYLPTRVSLSRRGPGDFAITHSHPCARIGPRCLVPFLGARTWIRTFDWKDQRTFLERTIASGGDSVRMLINLAGSS